MPTLAAWLSDTTAIPATERAALAWKRINDKPTSVTFRSATGSTVAAQLVRIESDNTATAAESAAGSAAKRKVIVFGVRNHPTVADTDIKEGYRFVLLNDEYKCVDTILTLGEIQGVFEAIG